MVQCIPCCLLYLILCFISWLLVFPNFLCLFSFSWPSLALMLSLTLLLPFICLHNTHIEGCPIYCCAGHVLKPSFPRILYLPFCYVSLVQISSDRFAYFLLLSHPCVRTDLWIQSLYQQGLHCICHPWQGQPLYNPVCMSWLHLSWSTVSSFVSWSLHPSWWVSYMISPIDRPKNFQGQGNFLFTSKVVT